MEPVIKLNNEGIQQDVDAFNQQWDSKISEFNQKIIDVVEKLKNKAESSTYSLEKLETMKQGVSVLNNDLKTREKKSVEGYKFVEGRKQENVEKQKQQNVGKGEPEVQLKESYSSPISSLVSKIHKILELLLPNFFKSSESVEKESIREFEKSIKKLENSESIIKKRLNDEMNSFNKKLDVMQKEFGILKDVLEHEDIRIQQAKPLAEERAQLLKKGEELSVVETSDVDLQIVDPDSKTAISSVKKNIDDLGTRLKFKKIKLEQGNDRLESFERGIHEQVRDEINNLNKEFEYRREQLQLVQEIALFTESVISETNTYRDVLEEKGVFNDKDSSLAAQWSDMMKLRVGLKELMKSAENLPNSTSSMEKVRIEFKKNSKLMKQYVTNFNELSKAR